MLRLKICKWNWVISVCCLLGINSKYKCFCFEKVKVQSINEKHGGDEVAVNSLSSSVSCCSRKTSKDSKKCDQFNSWCYLILLYLYLFFFIFFIFLFFFFCFLFFFFFFFFFFLFLSLTNYLLVLLYFTDFFFLINFNFLYQFCFSLYFFISILYSCIFVWKKVRNNFYLLDICFRKKLFELKKQSVKKNVVLQMI